MKSSRNRRQFLKGCCVLGAAGMASQLERLGMVTAHAQGAADYKALVCIFLFGGNDANNTIVPIDGRHADYRTMRGAVALNQAALLPAGASAILPVIVGLPGNISDAHNLQRLRRQERPHRLHVVAIGSERRK